MAWLLVGLIVFLGVHSVSIVAPARRDAWAKRMGVGPWKGAYSLVALLGFALIVYGWSQARLSPVVVWESPVWTRHITMLLMLPVLPLLLAAYLPGRVKALAKHPMLVATKLWALSHLLTNGSLHEMLLFGAFLAWAVADRVSVKRRAGANAMPAALPAWSTNDAVVVVGGLALYVFFVLKGHLWLVGMPILRG